MEHLYLVHHGIPGQKWGVRRYQNKDGSLTEEGKKRRKYEALDNKNYVYKPGSKFYRVYTKLDKKDSNSYKNKRLYVSDDAGDYLNDYFIDDPYKIRVQEITANKKMVFAGKRETNRILKEIGKLPMLYNRDLDNVNDNKKIKKFLNNRTDSDFLLKDEKLGEEFIKKALEEGYSGIRDPVDDYGMHFSNTAKILFNPKDYTISKKVGNRWDPYNFDTEENVEKRMKERQAQDKKDYEEHLKKLIQKKL